MKKYYQIIKAYFRYSLMLEIEYKFNFLFGGLFELLWLIMYIVLIDVIYMGTNNIGGWTKYQVLMLTFQGGLVDSLFTFFIVPGLGQLPNDINTGKLDFYLLKPINNRFIISMREFSCGQIKNIFINVIGIIYCVIRLKLEISLIDFGSYLCLTVLGVLIIYCIIFILMCLAFWVMKMDIVMDLCPQLVTIGNKPYKIYPNVLQKFFCFGIPILIAFNFPLIYLLKIQSPLIILISFITAIFWFIISNFIFKRGLKKYVSASS